MSQTADSGALQRESMLARFALPGPVAARIAENSLDHGPLASNTALPLEAAVIVAGTSRNYHTLWNLLHNVPHPDVLHAVLSQRRETRKTVLCTVLSAWNMDEAAQHLFVDRALPASVADEYLRNLRWFPEPAAKAVLRVKGPAAAEHLAELADTDLPDETLATVASAIIENTKPFSLGQQAAAAAWLAEACWLRPAVKQAALESDTSTAVTALALTGLTADEAAAVVAKLAKVRDPATARHAAKLLLMNPTVPAGTRLQTAEQYPQAAVDAAEAGAHRPGTAIAEGQLLRDVDDLDILDKAVAGTSLFTQLADLIEHPVTSRDPHIMHRLVKLSETRRQANQSGPLHRKLLAHITRTLNSNELSETFKKVTASYLWRRTQRQIADRDADRDAVIRNGTQPRQSAAGWTADTTRGSRWKPGTESAKRRAVELAQQPVAESHPHQMNSIGRYWREQLGEGDTDQSASAWQTALDMVCAVPEQSSADIIKLAKTLAQSN